MLTHTQLSMICFSFSKAFLLRCSSEIPVIFPQNPSGDLCTCFDKALAPTLSFGGLGLPSSCSALKIVYRLLKLSKTEVSGIGHTSLDPLVLRIPRHVKNPLGLRATKRSFISLNKFWLSFMLRASKTSSTAEVSLDKVSTSKWVSSE